MNSQILKRKVVYGVCDGGLMEETRLDVKTWGT
jgi:hypothetical protein